jgi:hypothetical protein
VEYRTTTQTTARNEAIADPIAPSGSGWKLLFVTAIPGDADSWPMLVWTWGRVST